MYNCCLFQLDHRILATTTLLSITGMWVATRNLPVDPRIRVLLNATLGMAAIQVSSTYLHAQKLALFGFSEVTVTDISCILSLQSSTLN